MDDLNNTEIDAGSFSSWLHETLKSLKTGMGMNVPCGACTGCCTSSYFIRIKPFETGAISRIPKELLFPAPGLSRGNYVLGYDENGHCPMFKNGKCKIYNSRPETCRLYDCRIFSATGIPVDSNRNIILERIKQWRFSFPENIDRAEYDAVRNCAEFIRRFSSHFPKGFIPNNPTQLAVLAIKIYEVFLDADLNNIENKSEIIKMITDILES